MKNSKLMKLKKTTSDYFIDSIAFITVTLAMIMTLYPFIYTFSCSISNTLEVLAGHVFLWPIGFSLEAYKRVLNNSEIWLYYWNTIQYTFAGTFLSVLFTCITAYPLSRKNFFARNFFTMYCTLPMFVSGGLIPYFLVVIHTGLYNNKLAMIIPSLIAVWNLIICRTFFMAIPEELIDSATVDGCSHFRILLNIVMPCSKAVIAVLVIFYGVGQWNSWFNAILFLPNTDLHPVQIYLRRVLLQLSPDLMSTLAGKTDANAMFSFFQIKYAVAMVVIGPIILIYPFLQKYFVKGVMIGSLKG